MHPPDPGTRRGRPPKYGRGGCPDPVGASCVGRAVPAGAGTL